MDKFTEMAKSYVADYNLNEIYEGVDLEEAASVGNEHAAKELHLYAGNHAQLHKQRIMPVVANLSKKHAKGTYDHEKAKKLWKYVADDAAKHYGKEFGGKFSAGDRRMTASALADEHRDEHGWGTHKESVQDSCHSEPALPKGKEDSTASAENKKIKAKEVSTPVKADKKVAEPVQDHDLEFKKGVRKEEVEQIEELSADTLKSYKSKAIFDLKGATARINSFEPKDLANRPKDAADSDVDMIMKRNKGLHAANRRLNNQGLHQKNSYNEEVEQIEESNVVRDFADHDDSYGSGGPESLGKNDAKYRAKTFPKGRVNKGTYGTKFNSAEEDHENTPDKKKTYTTGANPMVPKVIAPAKAAAKTVTQGVQTQKAGKTISPERRAAVQARAAKMKDPVQKAKMLKSIGEEVEQLSEHGDAWEQQPHDPRDQNPFKPGGDSRNHSDSGWLPVVDTPRKAKNSQSTRQSLAASSHERTQGIATAVKKLTKEGTEETNFGVGVWKEGSIYHYNVTLGEEVLTEGRAISTDAAKRQADQFINMVIEQIESQPEPMEVTDFVALGKILASNK